MNFRGNNCRRIYGGRVKGLEIETESGTQLKIIIKFKFEARN